MNVNVKISISDENRRKIHENFYGGKKGMISRKDVNAICQAAITDWLMGRNSGPEVEAKAEEEFADQLRSDELFDMGNGELVEALIEAEKQNKLLTTRVNQLQHKLDTRN